MGRTAQASQNYHLPKNTLELGKSSKSIGTNLPAPALLCQRGSKLSSFEKGQITPFTQDQKHLVVFKELGLMFNPSNLSDAWMESHTNIAESVTDYLNSDHRFNSWPMNEAQTLFKTLPSVELLNLEAARFITDPIPKIIKDTCQQENETFN